MAQIESGASSDKLTIDATSKAARATIYDTSGNPIVRTHGATLTGVTGAAFGGYDHDQFRLVRLSRYGTQEIGFRRLLMNEVCEGTTLNGQRWTTTATTLTATQAATGITLNGSAVTTINSGVLLTSRSAYLWSPGSPVHFHTRMRSTLVANQVGEWGIAQMATLSGVTVQVDNGASWRFNSAGSVVPVVYYNSTEVTGSDISGSLVNTNYYDWDIVLDDDRAVFICARSDTGAIVSEQTLRFPLAQQKAFAVTHLNAWFRLRNTGSVPASAGQMIVGECAIWSLDVMHNITWDQQLAELTMGASISPTAFTQAQQFANSAAPTSATLSNTAAGYTTLGGLYQFAAVAGAATDYCLFGFAVPATYRLKIKGVHVSMWNTGAANAATPATTCAWGLGLNGASANLSTGGHIRRLIGQTSIPISAAIGAASPDIDTPFPEPLICEPGTTLAVIMRVVAGAATASQVIQGSVDIRGVFE